MPEQVATPPASDAAPAEPAVEKPEPAGETPQPTEPQPTEPQPTEPQPTEPQAAVSRPAESESESAGPESAQSRPAGPESTESRPAGPQPTEPRPAEPQSAEPQSAEPESAESRPAGPESAGPESAGPESAEPEVKKSGAKKALGIAGAILAVVVVAGLKFGVVSAIGNFVNKDETAAAKAGDCIAKLPEVTGTKQEKVTDARIVACTSTEAAYNVVGRVEDQTEAQARAGTACEQYFKPDEEGYIYSTIMPGKTGYVLCLTKKA
ncbi:hypothetical protein ABZU25_03940 [Micromonospora sp. NPDC005215]|uniref:LppU/SCO3897 family protein n=1 Tax=Micromonospora sp. NPDC005215 TaxID=3157024 RepID=UPI0033A5C19C